MLPKIRTAFLHPGFRAKRGTQAPLRYVCISPRRSRRALFQHGAILFYPPNSRRVGMPP